MFNQRFRAIYLAATIVLCVGLFGIVTIPAVHATTVRPQLNSGDLQPTIQQRMFSSSKPLMGFATLGILSSAGLALLYSKNRG